MSGTRESLVSVIVPAWNAEDTLAETLRSAAAQTYSDLEILVVNDGSADSTAEIARQFCADDPRFRLIEKERGGLASARNRGIDEANGAWIAPLDADDLWHPEKIERQLQTLVRGSTRVGFTYCWYRMIDAEARVIERPWSPVMVGSVFEEHLRLNFGTGSSPLINRGALGELRYSTELSRVDDGGAEDWLLQLKLAKHFHVACTRAYLVGYRQRSDSMSADKSRMLRSYIRMFEILRRDAAGRERNSIDREISRWRAIQGLSRLSEAPASALLEIFSELMRAPFAISAAILSDLNRRHRSRDLRNHSSVRKQFFDLSPDHE